MSEEKNNLEKVPEQDQKNNTSQNTNKTTLISSQHFQFTDQQKIEFLKNQLESLERRYNMEKILLDERAKIKQEEINSLKAHISEQQTMFKIELRRREEEINNLRQRMLEAENKYLLEQTISKEKIKFKEEEIKELKAKYEQEIFRITQQIETLQNQIKIKEEENRRLEGMLSKRENELAAQIEWKQQELAMTRLRFEEELKKAQLELSTEKSKFEEELRKRAYEFEENKKLLIKELTEVQTKYAQEQLRAEKLLARLEELQKEHSSSRATYELLSRQVEEFKRENYILRETIYTPEHIAKTKMLEMHQKIVDLEKRIEEFQQIFAKEQLEKDTVLRQKEEEVQLLKVEVEQYKHALAEQSAQLTEDVERELRKKISKLEEEKISLQTELELVNKEKENRFAETQMILSEKDETYSYFIDDMARGFLHKIRNLVGVVNGVVEFCIGILDEAYKKFSPTKNFLDKVFGKTKIYNSVNETFTQFKENFAIATQHVSLLLTSLEKFRNVSKPVILTKQKANLEAILTKIISFNKENADKQKIEIKTEFSSNVPEVDIDGPKMESVFNEIVVNAIEAMPKGGMLRVQTDYESQTRFVFIRFIDTGIGIAESQVGKVFQPFFSNKVNRDGMGLTMAQRVVLTHNGKITVQSEKGKGTVVTVKLPVV